VKVKTAHPEPVEGLAAIEDKHKYVLKRFEHVYVMLNLYPYNPGHLMVIPFQHVGTLHELAPAARAELMEVASQSSVILEQELKIDGLNMGLNIGGKAAGGTIPEHLHLHVLPRFNGDTNFLPLLSQTKQISLNLPELYQQLKKAFNA
jgi:ATP adenylyltransferase